MPPVIRPARLEDAEAMARYMAELMAEDLDVVARRPPPSAAEERAWVEEALGRPDALVLAAAAGEEIVGLLDLVADSRPHFRHGARLGMSVARAWRGQGLGRRMLQAALQEARTWPAVCRVELEVTPWNLGAIRLYESCGFQLEGRRRKAVDLRGKPEDMLMMAVTW